MADGLVLLHPNYGDSCVLVHGEPYHWDGSINAYRTGYGPYSTIAQIGEWQSPTADQARRIRREVKRDR